jgi:hypothetical protein
LFLFTQGHDWNRRAGVFSSSFELLLLGGEIYLCIFCCVRLSVYILILYSDKAVTGLFVFQFFKYIIPVDIFMIYNKLNVTLLYLYFLVDRHDTF